MKLKSYGTDPFGARKAEDKAIGDKLLKKLLKIRLKHKIGDEMYLSFINERLIKGKADFSDSN